ncbi:Disease resistance protein RPS2 [Camellia lanceoleosa]|uniref:Disease resistance protein RPS2 n=1 Tax=Camellia lanceoleosa TaxID=1840588 RepID=A0ACC0GG48_9ERIC|nr:Disease resistance protein RPS2 [Camellia lanceoleosa]
MANLSLGLCQVLPPQGGVLTPMCDSAVKQVKLTTIEKLDIFGMENLMEIWPGELQDKLREMKVCSCHELSNILSPSNSIKGMQNLELLEVRDCRSIGVAFDCEGLVWEGGISDMAFPSLKEVKLIHLPRLTQVWKDDSPGIQGFQNLRSLIVNDCDSLRNLFSHSLAKLLVKLQEIEVTECGMMESIIANEPNEDDAALTNIIMFPQLSSLKLSDLPNFRSFCSQAWTFEGSLLKTIEVINCPKMKVLPSAFRSKLAQQKADFSTSSLHHLLDGKLIFRVDHIFGNLRKLTITDINGSIEMWQNQLDVGRIDKVTFMLVQFCGKLSSVISLNFVRRLRYLQQLKVWWCDSLETIFDLQGSVCASTTGEEGSSTTVLKHMKLMYLAKLMHIWMNVSQHSWSFTNLISLEVEKCDNLRYIFPISMVKGLVSLKYLRIENCEKVEKIVTGKAEVERGKINILSVELQNLPSLVCFGIPESEIHISKLRVDFCPKYRGNQLYFYANMFLSF